jgi:asparagine synthase (glutamine-hydrolysing)
MGYIAAALNRHGQDVSQTILIMLKSACRRQALSYGIANYRNTELRKTAEFTSHTSSILIGSKNIFPDIYPPEPLHQGDHSIVFSGVLFNTDEPDSLTAANTLKNDPVKGIETLITRRNGSYSVVAATKKSIIAGIDYIGTIPLYYGENIDCLALSTNKKMLWAIGIEPTPLKPGQMLKITETGITKTQIKTLEKPRSTLTTVDALHKIMIKSTKEYATKTPKATVAFSGGIDSLLTAYYLQQNNVQLELIWTGLEKQPEIYIAQEAADCLGLRLNIDGHTLLEVENTLDSILSSIEEPDPVKTGIALPFYWAAKNTYDNGYITMYSGSGADELFAGYKRYLEKYLKGRNPNETIFIDILNSYLQNFHRDTKICLDQNTRLFLPFTHPRLVEYGLSIPIEQKLPFTIEDPRKKILRELAISRGIPEKLANRPKKAAQYSSGVNKALKKIARKDGMNLRELVKLRFAHLKSKYPV